MGGKGTSYSPRRGDFTKIKRERIGVKRMGWACPFFRLCKAGVARGNICPTSQACKKDKKMYSFDIFSLATIEKKGRICYTERVRTVFERVAV